VRSSLTERDERAERVPPRIWNVALLWGEIPFVALAAIGELLAFVQYFLGGLSPSVFTVLRLGGLYFYGFNHVLIKAEATRSGINGSFFSFEGAFLAVTMVAVYLLFRGGSEVGDRIAGSPGAKALAGASVALPYAALSLMISYAVAVSFRLPADLEGGELRVSVSHLQAFLWPLVIGVLAGLAGGLWSARSDLARSAWGKRLVSAIAGGWRMLLYGLGLSLVGLLVVGAANPSTVRSYFDDTLGSGLVGPDLLVHHALALPNQSTWVLVPAMGACDRIQGASGRAGSEAFLCYSRFPRHGEFLTTLGGELGSGKRITSPVAPVRFTAAPPGYLLFLAVPLLATLAAGAAAGPRANPESRGEAAIVGALSGVVFAALVAVSSVLAGIGVHLTGGGDLTVGPDPVGGGLLALAWGVLGGAAGATLAFREPRSRHRPMDRRPGHLAQR
jgi:hypothetical protein